MSGTSVRSKKCLSFFLNLFPIKSPRGNSQVISTAGLLSFITRTSGDTGTLCKLQVCGWDVISMDISDGWV